MKNEVKVHCELGTKGRIKIGTIFGLKKSTTEKMKRMIQANRAIEILQDESFSKGHPCSFPSSTQDFELWENKDLTKTASKGGEDS